MKTIDKKIKTLNQLSVGKNFKVKRFGTYDSVIDFINRFKNYESERKMKVISNSSGKSIVIKNNDREIKIPRCLAKKVYVREYKK